MSGDGHDVAAAGRPAAPGGDADLLRQARPARIDPSRTPEQRRHWLEANRGAIRAFNDYIDRHGSIADDHRSF